MPAALAGIWGDAGERYRLVLIASGAAGVGAQALLYGKLDDGRRFVLAATRVTIDGARLELDLPPVRAYRSEAGGVDALAGHRAELPPDVDGPAASRWQAEIDGTRLQLRCVSACTGWPPLPPLRRIAGDR